MLGLEKDIDKFLVVILVVGVIGVGMIFMNKKNSIKKVNDIQREREIKQILDERSKEKIEGGRVWLVFSEKVLKKGQKFEVKIYGDVSGEKLGVFSIDFRFSPEEMAVDFSEGDRGVTKGGDVIRYISSVNVEQLDKGLYKIAGMTVNEHAQEENIHLITIGLESKKEFEIDLNFDWLQVNEMTNDLGRSFDIEHICKNIEIR